MERRFIRLPAIDKMVPLGAYVAAVKMAKANPTKTFKTGLTTWWPTTGAEIEAQYLTGLHERINAAVPYIGRGTQ